jgi:hypothetical protein
MRDAMRKQYKESTDEVMREEARWWLMENDRVWLEQKDYNASKFRIQYKEPADAAQREAARRWLVDNDRAWLAREDTN